jgi:uncharacterized protein GlcG (DUF336 family)
VPGIALEPGGIPLVNTKGEVIGAMALVSLDSAADGRAARNLAAQRLQRQQQAQAPRPSVHEQPPTQQQQGPPAPGSQSAGAGAGLSGKRAAAGVPFGGPALVERVKPRWGQSPLLDLRNVAGLKDWPDLASQLWAARRAYPKLNINLEGADLREADLHDTDLSGANLSSAQLQGANLRGVNMKGARFDAKTQLRGADLTRASADWDELKHAVMSPDAADNLVQSLASFDLASESPTAARADDQQFELLARALVHRQAPNRPLQSEIGLAGDLRLTFVNTEPRPAGDAAEEYSVLLSAHVADATITMWVADDTGVPRTLEQTHVADLVPPGTRGMRLTKVEVVAPEWKILRLDIPRLGAGGITETVPEQSPVRVHMVPNDLEIGGHRLGKDDIAALSGAPPGSMVVAFTRRGAAGGPDSLSINVIPRISDRHVKWTLQPAGEGEPQRLMLDQFPFKEERQQQGIGLKILTKAATKATEFGIDEILVSAVGKGGQVPSANRGPDIATYAFAKYGFNAELKPEDRVRMKSEALRLGIDIDTVPDVLTLMQLPGGDQLWKDFGTSRTMHFDMRRSPASLKALLTYLKDKHHDVPQQLDDRHRALLAASGANLPAAPSVSNAMLGQAAATRMQPRDGEPLSEAEAGWLMQSLRNSTALGPVTGVVVDAHGKVLASTSTDGAPIEWLASATARAQTAHGFRRPAADPANAIVQGDPEALRLQAMPGIAPEPGGVPLLNAAGEVVGAIVLVSADSAADARTAQNLAVQWRQRQQQAQAPSTSVQDQPITWQQQGPPAPDSQGASPLDGDQADAQTQTTSIRQEAQGKPLEDPSVTAPNPLTTIARAIQAFGNSPAGKLAQLSPLLVLTSSGRLPEGLSFTATVDTAVKGLTAQIEQIERQSPQVPGLTPYAKGAKDAKAPAPTGITNWSSVNQARVDQPVTLRRPLTPGSPTLIDGLDLKPRSPNRTYADVLYQRSSPFYGNTGALFVPNAVFEQGVGVKGRGAHPKDWGNGFLRFIQFTFQPVEFFLSKNIPLDRSSQTTQGSAFQVRVGNPGGDYFADGTHREPLFGGGLSLDNFGDSKSIITKHFAEGFVNFPQPRRDIVTVGGRVMLERGERRFDSVFGSRRDNATPGQTSYQLGAPYSWGQNNIKFSQGFDPWSGYAYVGLQEEIGVKVVGVSRDHAAPGAKPESNWHLVSGKVLADTGDNRRAWQEAFDSSGLTLLSESLVPSIGEKTAQVFAAVDDKLINAGGTPAAIRQLDGIAYVKLSDVSARLVATGRTLPAYGELAGVMPAKFAEINRPISRLINGEAYVARDSWVRTGTVVVEGLQGLALPSDYARPVLKGSHGEPQIAFPKNKLEEPVTLPQQASPPARSPAGLLANNVVQGSRWQITGDSTTAQQKGIRAALENLDVAQIRYETVIREGKSWFQNTVDAGRQFVWGAPDAQVENFEQRRGELLRLLSRVTPPLNENSSSAANVADNAHSIRSDLDSIAVRYKSEYRRVFDEQVRNAEIAQTLWWSSRGVVLSAAAAAAIGAVTVGSKRGRPGPSLMAGFVGMAAVSAFDASSLLIGKTGPAANGHFAPQIRLQSPGSYAMASVIGDVPGDWGAAATKGLGDAMNAAGLALALRLRKSADRKLMDVTEKYLGSTGAISALINSGPKQRIDGTGGAGFWINGLAADTLRFGGTASMSLAQALAGDLVGAGLNVIPATLFDPTRFYGGADGKLAEAGRKIVFEVNKNLSESLVRAAGSGVTNVLNFRRGGELFDAAANTLLSVATGTLADQLDGGVNRVNAAAIAPDALKQPIENISSRYVPLALDRDREFEPQTAAFYARKFGVPEAAIRFFIGVRHGQSGANLPHITAGNVIQAEAQLLGTFWRWNPSLHWLGRAAAQVRDFGLYGTVSKFIVDNKYSLAGIDPPDVGVPSTGRLQHPADTNIDVVARIGGHTVSTTELGDALSLRQPEDDDAKVAQRMESLIAQAAGQIWEQQLVDNSHGYDLNPPSWIKFNVPLTKKGESEALRARKTMTELFRFLGDRPINITISPVLRAKLTAQLVTGDAMAKMPERFDGTGAVQVQIRFSESPGSRERGQGYLVFSVKVGVEFGKGDSGFKTLMSGNWGKWTQGLRKAVLDNLAGNMAWPPPSAAGKLNRVLEFEVPIGELSEQTRVETKRVRVRLRDETGYETINQFRRRVKNDLVDAHILPSFRAGFDAADISHQFTKSVTHDELQKPLFNPLFRQDVKAVGAAIPNGMPHLTVFYMDKTGKPRVLDAGYVKPEWAAKRHAAALEATDLSTMPRHSPERRVHETELVRAVAERDVLLKRSTAMLRLEREYSREMYRGSNRGMPPDQSAIDYLQKLDVLRTGLQHIGAGSPELTLRWDNDLQTLQRFFPADQAVGAEQQPEHLAWRVSNLMRFYHPKTGKTPPDQVEVRDGLASFHDEITRALVATADSLNRERLAQRGDQSSASRIGDLESQGRRLQQLRDHVWYLYEQIGDPNSAPAEVHRWRQNAS